MAHSNHSITKTDSEWKKSIHLEEAFPHDLYAHFMLKKVSRTFALNIQVLPTKLKHQVLLSYLFCRMADTLEDDIRLIPEIKIALLGEFQQLFPITPHWRQSILDIKEKLPSSWKNSDTWDHLLTYHMLPIFELYSQLPSKEQNHIAKWVKEMCVGMAEFTAHQAKDHKKFPLIQNMQELDKYCYYVAGTVGNLLCDLFSQYSKWITKKDKIKLDQLAVSFGLGLQLTNILKDVTDDLDRNVLFIPDDLLKQYHVDINTLLLPENQEHLQGIIRVLVKKAQSHLMDALEYTCLLPRLEPKLRLFCLWPLFMALDTLILIAKSSSYQTSKPKITRAQVNEIIKKTSWACWSNHLIRKLFNVRITKLNAILD